MIAQAEERSSGSVDYQVSTIEDWQPNANAFDAIVSFSMLEYVDDDANALTKLTTSLKPGGIFVISVPNRPGLVRKLEKLIYTIRRLSRDNVFAGRGEYLRYQKHQYTPFELNMMMRDSGLRKVDSCYMNSGFDPKSSLRPLLERRWWAALYCAVYRKN
jgi:SAM-dependent methyltransferase